METPKKDHKTEDDLIKISKILYKNNSKRLKLEHIELKSKNKDLNDILQDIHAFCYNTFKKDVVVTMIFRTNEEQQNIYKDNVKFKQKPFKSPHQFYHAVDLRSSIFSKEEINTLVNYLNNTYNKTNYYKWTAKCHNVGHGDHFHVQFARKD